MRPAIRVSHVDKSFRIPEHRQDTLKERVLHPMRRSSNELRPTLTDVSVDIGKGEFFGILGRNGSGKSTLLKCIAGIYAADRGNIWIDGRLSTFIELGVGFNPDLAAYDNVVTNGIMLGLSPREARARYEQVIEFAELEDFQDLKLKNYSSGMNVRLAFAVAIQVDADILLIDEVLAVGDAAFQQKCFDVFHDLRDRGKTIVFVTHDTTAVERFCHRAMLIERGEVVTIGDPEDVTERYLEVNFGPRTPEPEPEPEPQAEEQPPNIGDARVVEAWICDDAGERLTMALQGRPVTLAARVAFARDVISPMVSVNMHNEDHDTVLVATTTLDNPQSGTFAAGEEAVFTFTFDNVLAPGRYTPQFVLAHYGGGLDRIDRYDEFSFVVSGTRALGGLVDVPVRTTVTHAGTPSARDLAS